MDKVHFVVHDKRDSVGVVVVEGVKAQDLLSGWIMDQDETIQLKALDDIPIGHKVAVAPLADGATVIKYGMDIGRATAPIEAGRHVHVQNLATKRW